MENQTKIFFGISLVLSYLIITEGNFFFAGWLLFVVPIYALWLNAPAFFGDDKKSGGVIIGYIIWVAIQWAIYHFALWPTGGPLASPYF